MSLCQHVDELKSVRSFSNVTRDECTQCFESQDQPEGVNVCLTCFNCGCISQGHSQIHYERTGHALALNIHRKLRIKSNDESRPLKLTKLEIRVEADPVEEYDIQTRVECLAGHGTIIDPPEFVQSLITQIIEAPSTEKKSQIEAWEQETISCEHILTLDQLDNHEKLDLSKCAKCDLNYNLWICLHCGSIGCGRPQFGGGGGNGHALAHFEETGHAVSVKLGSIDASGTADVYCYLCNDERKDDYIQEHLLHWNIDIRTSEKKEKSLIELQLEHNLNFEFNMTDQDGINMTKVFGPGLTGIKNLGNSCYLASIVQSLFSLPEFGGFYASLYQTHAKNCNNQDHSQCIDCQMTKMADGLLSGRYSIPDPNTIVEENQVAFQKGLVPAMFKNITGKGHEEFSTSRQQDAFEYLIHLSKLISRSCNPNSDIVNTFRFILEQRIECLACGGVRYQENVQENLSIPLPKHILESDGNSDDKINLIECIQTFFEPEIIDYKCSGCGENKDARKTVGFKTFPESLVVQIQRFKLVNWIPQKVNTLIEMPNSQLSLDTFKSHGLLEGEKLLPEDAEIVPEQPKIDADKLVALESMGFAKILCEKALRATNDASIDEAVAWLMEHLDDADIYNDESTNISTVDDSVVQQLQEMGFSATQARKALMETQGNMERAVDWLFNHPDFSDNDIEQQLDAQIPGNSNLPASYSVKSVVCHKGSSIHAGHYICLIRKNIEDTDKWVMFNDEKVVESSETEEVQKSAYVFFLTRNLT